MLPPCCPINSITSAIHVMVSAVSPGSAGCLNSRPVPSSIVSSLHVGKYLRSSSSLLLSFIAWSLIYIMYGWVSRLLTALSLNEHPSGCRPSVRSVMSRLSSEAAGESASGYPVVMFTGMPGGMLLTTVGSSFSSARTIAVCLPASFLPFCSSHCGMSLA